MADDDLIRLAREHRISTHYVDWQGRDTEVSPGTILAVLAGLGVDASTPQAVRAELVRSDEERRTRLLPPVVICRRHEIAVPESTELLVEPAGGGAVVPLPIGERGAFRLPDDIPLGWHRLRAKRGSCEQSAALLVAPVRLGKPQRTWGLMTQLYSIRSRDSWGLGDLGDLSDLAIWSGRDLGAGFVLVNPLHATEPVPPIGPSPYSPMSRRYASPLYLWVEDVLEFDELSDADRERIAALAGPQRERVHTLDPLDRNSAWTAKRQALELLHRQPRSTTRQESYERFKSGEGEALTAFATWCALAEVHGSDWRRWPAELHDAQGKAVAGARHRLAERVDFHAWLQWQLDQQLAATQADAYNAGMPIGIVHDLAVGVSPASADAWTYRPLLAAGMSVGAPPDEFNQLGQDWGQPPWHPERLAEAEYRPYRQMLAGVLRHAGGLRLDHAMQVSRLWWIPEGGSPADGTYVGYDRDALLSCLAWEAAQADAVVIGEDLGTVEADVREDLADRDILGTSLLWFEQDRKGRPKSPRQWRELSLATVGTHDMPPITGFLHGDHIGLRERLGLLTRPADEEQKEHQRQLAEWLSLLGREGLLTTRPADIVRALANGSSEHDAEVVAALHAFLARTPALLLGVSLADAVGERRTQNQPGTTDEYPNWRIPMADAEGRPVLLDDLRQDPAVRAAIAPVRLSGESPHDAGGHVVQESARDDGSARDR